MRDIKFRGLTTKGEMIYGSLVITTHTAKQHTKTWIVQSAFGNGGWFNVMGKQYVRPETVGQFTGLMDKNQLHEAYVNDILDTSVRNAVICFGEYDDHVGFYVDFQDEVKNSVYRHDLKYWLSTSEVIGNLHQQPELVQS